MPPFIRAFNLLLRHFGPQRWWPGDTPFEVCVGAILTQNTAWTNVEKAIANLRRAGVLSPSKMRALHHAKLAALIRPAGYFNVKARRLRSFLDFLRDEFRGDLSRMFRLSPAVVREKLLGVNGIGPETADSILLYAGGRESFVVDAYTRRVLTRHGWAPCASDYHEIKAIFEQSLAGNPKSEIRNPKSKIPRPTGHPPSGMSVASERHSPRARLFNEYHALIVAVGKHYCLSREPRCEACPLRPLLPRAGACKP
ncbi:MAG: endonuclease III domain-containing protein [Verrucomicrobia bacterium]|nr:endonuclease III domain-containing protein [Verrucomicrobiota bacterium]